MPLEKMGKGITPGSAAANEARLHPPDTKKIPKKSDKKKK